MPRGDRSKLVSIGDSAFSVVEPKCWNEVPDDVRSSFLSSKVKWNWSGEVKRGSHSSLRNLFTC